MFRHTLKTVLLEINPLAWVLVAIFLMVGPAKADVLECASDAVCLSSGRICCAADFASGYKICRAREFCPAVATSPRPIALPLPVSSPAPVASPSVLPLVSSCLANGQDCDRNGSCCSMVCSKETEVCVAAPTSSPSPNPVAIVRPVLNLLPFVSPTPTPSVPGCLANGQSCERNARCCSLICSKELEVCVAPSVPVAPSDLVPPTPGNSGNLLVTGFTSTALILSWKPATDNVTPSASLLYQVRRSLKSAMKTVVTVEANGEIVKDWTPNLLRYDAKDLIPGVTYYFNVLVKDAAGNQALHKMQSRKMPLPKPSPTPSPSVQPKPTPVPSPSAQPSPTSSNGGTGSTSGSTATGGTSSSGTGSTSSGSSSGTGVGGSAGTGSSGSSGSSSSGSTSGTSGSGSSSSGSGSGSGTSGSGSSSSGSGSTSGSTGGSSTGGSGSSGGSSGSGSSGGSGGSGSSGSGSGSSGGSSGSGDGSGSGGSGSSGGSGGSGSGSGSSDMGWKFSIDGAGTIASFGVNFGGRGSSSRYAISSQYSETIYANVEYTTQTLTHDGLLGGWGPYGGVGGYLPFGKGMLLLPNGTYVPFNTQLTFALGLKASQSVASDQTCNGFPGMCLGSAGAEILGDTVPVIFNNLSMDGCDEKTFAEVISPTGERYRTSKAGGSCSAWRTTSKLGDVKIQAVAVPSVGSIKIDGNAVYSSDKEDGTYGTVTKFALPGQKIKIEFEAKDTLGACISTGVVIDDSYPPKIPTVTEEVTKTGIDTTEHSSSFIAEALPRGGKAAFSFRCGSVLRMPSNNLTVVVQSSSALATVNAWGPYFYTGEEVGFEVFAENVKTCKLKILEGETEVVNEELKVTNGIAQETRTFPGKDKNFKAQLNCKDDAGFSFASEAISKAKGIPTIKFTEKLNLEDYVYPECIEGSASYYGDCEAYTDFVDPTTNKYNKTRTIEDKLETPHSPQSIIHSESVIFGSILSLEIANPPAGETCKLWRAKVSANGAPAEFEEVGTSFEGKVQHGDEGLLDDGKNLTFQVRCSSEDLPSRQFGFSLFTRVGKQAAALISQEEIPGPVLNMNAVIGGKKQLIKDGSRVIGDTEVVEVTAIKNAVNQGLLSDSPQWRKDRFIFAKNWVSVPLDYPVDGKFSPFDDNYTVGSVDFAVFVAPARDESKYKTFVFARGSYSQSRNYQLLAVMPASCYCGYNGEGQADFEAKFKKCFFEDIRKDVLTGLMTNLLNFVDAGVRFTPVVGQGYTAADLLLYEEKNFANVSIAVLMILSSGASSVGSVCVQGSNAARFARGVYIGSEVAQAGISIGSVARGKGDYGDYLQVGLLAYQGGRFTVAKSFQFAFKIPPGASAKGKASVVKGLPKNEKTELPENFQPLISNTVGADSLSVEKGITKVDNAKLAKTVKEVPGTEVPTKQVVSGSDQPEVSRNEVSFVTDKSALKCAQCASSTVDLSGAELLGQGGAGRVFKDPADSTRAIKVPIYQRGFFLEDAKQLSDKGQKFRQAVGDFGIDYQGVKGTVFSDLPPTGTSCSGDFGVVMENFAVTRGGKTIEAVVDNGGRLTASQMKSLRDGQKLMISSRIEHADTEKLANLGIDAKGSVFTFDLDTMYFLKNDDEVKTFLVNWGFESTDSIDAAMATVYYERFVTVWKKAGPVGIPAPSFDDWFTGNF